MASVIIFAISQIAIFFLLVVGAVSTLIVEDELDWLNIGMPCMSLVIMLVLGIQYSGVPLKSLAWRKSLVQFIGVSVYWTITRLFRGFTSIIGKLSDLNITVNLNDSDHQTVDYIMLIVVLLISEVLCVFIVLDYGFMSIFIFSEEEAEANTQILRPSDVGNESETIANTSILINHLTESAIINLSEITEGEEVVSRKNSLGKLYQATFKESRVLFRKIVVPRLSGYIVEELTTEIEVHRSMHYSHVLPIIGIVLELPVIGFVTPLMRKGSLYEALHVTQVKFSLTDKVRISSDISAGILNFHMQGKAHGHLNSHNILFDENYLPYISDLGFQKLKKYAGIVSGYTNIGAWSSPELIHDKRLTPIKAQIADDVYSFGMIVWEILAEQEPFPGYSRKQLVNTVVDDGNRPLIPTDTPGDVAELILKCWNPEAKQRPSFAEIFSVLSSYSSL